MVRSFFSQDYIRHVNRPPSTRRPEVKLTAQERKMLELKKEFGGGSRAEKMLTMVDKLHKAYKEGLDLRAEENKNDEWRENDSFHTCRYLQKMKKYGLFISRIKIYKHNQLRFGTSNIII